MLRFLDAPNKYMGGSSATCRVGEQGMDTLSRWRQMINNAREAR